MTNRINRNGIDTFKYHFRSNVRNERARHSGPATSISNVKNTNQSSKNAICQGQEILAPANNDKIWQWSNIIDTIMKFSFIFASFRYPIVARIPPRVIIKGISQGLVGHGMQFSSIRKCVSGSHSVHLGAKQHPLATSFFTSSSADPEQSAGFSTQRRNSPSFSFTHAYQDLPDFPPHFA